MSGSLTVDLGEGYRSAVLGLPEPTRAAMVASREALRSNRMAGDRADRLLGLVLAYRSGPRQVWAPVLLDVLAPSLLRLLKRLRVEPPYLGEEDVRQELVVELLSAAAEMPLPPRAAFLRRGLMARANQRVRRRLASEARRRAFQRQLDPRDEVAR